MSDVLKFRVRLSIPQKKLITSKSKFPAMVSGFGAGKSYAAAVRAILLKLKYPQHQIGAYYPTYDSCRNVGFPTFEAILNSSEIRYRLNLSSGTISIKGKSKILFRSMEKPTSLVGYEHCDALVDELATVNNLKQAAVWRRIISRNRSKKKDGTHNTIAVATTPEGFNFVYDAWKKDPKPGYELIHASTRSNQHNLTADYIDNMHAIYPANLLAAYVEGMFVNLVSGAVYPDFDRKLNSSDLTTEAAQTLHIGMDFNVLNMAAVVFVDVDKKMHAVTEITRQRDTPRMVAAIKSRFPHKRIIIYPDASGAARNTTNASESDLSILRSAGFEVRVNTTNPLVKDRLMAVNGMILNDGGRRVFVNIDKCPEATEALETQAFDKHGKPDKSSGVDHILDAFGYPIAKRYPIVRPNSMSRLRIVGM